MVNTPKDDSINKGKKVESENHQNEIPSMSEEEVKNQEKINEEISDEVESEKSKQKVEVDSLKGKLANDEEENIQKKFPNLFKKKKILAKKIVRGYKKVTFDKEQKLAINRLKLEEILANDKKLNSFIKKYSAEDLKKMGITPSVLFKAIKNNYKGSYHMFKFISQVFTIDKYLDYMQNFKSNGSGYEYSILLKPLGKFGYIYLDKIQNKSERVAVLKKIFENIKEYDFIKSFTLSYLKHYLHSYRSKDKEKLEEILDAGVDVNMLLGMTENSTLDSGLGYICTRDLIFKCSEILKLKSKKYDLDYLIKNGVSLNTLIRSISIKDLLENKVVTTDQLLRFPLNYLYQNCGISGRGISGMKELLEYFPLKDVINKGCYDKGSVNKPLRTLYAEYDDSELITGAANMINYICPDFKSFKEVVDVIGKENMKEYILSFKISFTTLFKEENLKLVEDIIGFKNIITLINNSRTYNPEEQPYNYFGLLKKYKYKGVENFLDAGIQNLSILKNIFGFERLIKVGKYKKLSIVDQNGKIIRLDEAVLNKYYLNNSYVNNLENIKKSGLFDDPEHIDPLNISDVINKFGLKEVINSKLLNNVSDSSIVKTVLIKKIVKLSKEYPKKIIYYNNLLQKNGIKLTIDDFKELDIPSSFVRYFGFVKSELRDGGYL